MSQPKILAFAGSTRQGSWNARLLQVAVAAAQQAGASVTRVDLAEYPLPLFNEDLEKESPPQRLVELQRLFLDHQGLLIAAPEYNSSITPLMKNTIDWVSRPFDDQPALAAYQHKVAGLLAASPGALGGLRGLVHLRAILQNIGVLVVPDQFALSRAGEAFDDAGKLQGTQPMQFVEKVVHSVLQTTSRLHG